MIIPAIHTALSSTELSSFQAQHAWAFHCKGSTCFPGGQMWQLWHPLGHWHSLGKNSGLSGISWLGCRHFFHPFLVARWRGRECYLPKARPWTMSQGEPFLPVPGPCDSPTAHLKKPSQIQLQTSTLPGCFQRTTFCSLSLFEGRTEQETPPGLSVCVCWWASRSLPPDLLHPKSLHLYRSNSTCSFFNEEVSLGKKIQVNFYNKLNYITVCASLCHTVNFI